MNVMTDSRIRVMTSATPSCLCSRLPSRKPRRGDLFIGEHVNTSLLFCFSAARYERCFDVGNPVGRECSDSLPGRMARRLKTKENNWDERLVAINRPPLRGFDAAMLS